MVWPEIMMVPTHRSTASASETSPSKARMKTVEATTSHPSHVRAPLAGIFPSMGHRCEIPDAVRLVAVESDLPDFSDGGCNGLGGRALGVGRRLRFGSGRVRGLRLASGDRVGVACR